MARTISHSFAVLTREIFSLPLEHKNPYLFTPLQYLHYSCFIQTLPAKIKKRELGRKRCVTTCGLGGTNELRKSRRTWKLILRLIISVSTIMFGISIITCAMFYDSMCYVLRSHVLCSMITQAMSFNHACTMSYNYTWAMIYDHMCCSVITWVMLCDHAVLVCSMITWVTCYNHVYNVISMINTCVHST